MVFWDVESRKLWVRAAGRWRRRSEETGAHFIILAAWDGARWAFLETSICGALTSSDWQRCERTFFLPPQLLCGKRMSHVRSWTAEQRFFVLTKPQKYFQAETDSNQEPGLCFDAELQQWSGGDVVRGQPLSTPKPPNWCGQSLNRLLELD